MATNDLLGNKIKNIVNYEVAKNKSNSEMRATTISGYRSTHATQLFKQGVGSPVIYLIGQAGNSDPPIVQ